MSPVEKKSIFLRLHRLTTSPEINTLGNKKWRRKGTEHTPIFFPWPATGDTGGNTFEFDCPKRRQSLLISQTGQTIKKKKKNKKTRNNQHDWTVWRAARYHFSAQLGHVHNMVQQVCFRMATSTSGKTTKSRNVQKTCTSHSDPTRRWETRATWGYTRTRTHLHGDRSGTTSPMGFGGTPTVYQDCSYTDKLHLIMRPQQKSLTILYRRTMAPSRNLGTSHMDETDKVTRDRIW